jgi:crooked neck
MARKVFGNAIGKCPKDKLFKAYIQLEMQLANFDRCRKIYERYLYIFPDNPTPWIGYAELECVLEEFDRARS